MIENTSTLVPLTEVVAYLRDSGGRDQELSIVQQEGAVVEWARKHGVIITHFYRDTASGTKTAGRDQFMQMVDYLDGKTRERGVILWEYSRFSRDFDDLMFYMSDLRRKGYAIYGVNETVPEGLDGRLMESITAWKNARFIADLRKNIMRGQRYVVSVHHARLGAKPPTGYRFVRAEIGRRRDGSPHVINKLEVDPDEAPLVRRAFEMRAAGATYKEIDAETHLFPWVSNYGFFFRNPIYIGIMQYGDEEYPGSCEPLVDTATWSRVQTINNERADMQGINHPRTVRSQFWLTGLLYCGKCGMTMHGHQSTGRKGYAKTFMYYRCHSASTRNRCGMPLINKGEIEGRVLAAIKKHLLDPAILADVYAEVRRQSEEQSANWESTVTQLHHNLASVRAQITRVVSAVRDAGHSQALLASLGELERQERDLQMQIAAAETQTPDVIDIDVSEFASMTQDALDNADDIERGIILRGLVKSIHALRNGKLEGEIECYVAGSETVIAMPL